MKPLTLIVHANRVYHSAESYNHISYRSMQIVAAYLNSLQAGESEKSLIKIIPDASLVAENEAKAARVIVFACGGGISFPVKRLLNLSGVKPLIVLEDVNWPVNLMELEGRFDVLTWSRYMLDPCEETRVNSFITRCKYFAPEWKLLFNQLDNVYAASYPHMQLAFSPLQLNREPDVKVTAGLVYVGSFKPERFKQLTEGPVVNEIKHKGLDVYGNVTKEQLRQHLSSHSIVNHINCKGRVNPEHVTSLLSMYDTTLYVPDYSIIGYGMTTLRHLETVIGANDLRCVYSSSVWLTRRHDSAANSVYSTAQTDDFACLMAAYNRHKFMKDNRLDDSMRQVQRQFADTLVDNWCVGDELLRRWLLTD